MFTTVLKVYVTVRIITIIEHLTDKRFLISVGEEVTSQYLTADSVFCLQCGAAPQKMSHSLKNIQFNKVVKYELS